MKKYSKMTKYLVIVESPAKCKKIEDYLGPQYKCMACFGHVRELSSLQHIQVEKNFEPIYTIIQNDIKLKQTEKIRKEIRQVNEVILATDDDREGEAIAWHLCQVFGLSVEKTKRIVFHEITESAIQQAVLEPRTLRLSLVYAQQARQILDLLVGFHISPVLWKTIASYKKQGLSAGRCQTPALRLVADNQREIDAHPGVLSYHMTGIFTHHRISFALNQTWESVEETEAFMEECVNHDYKMTLHPVTHVALKPPEPLSTSRLQQCASNEMHCSPKETMSLCQKLYEGGYITYMRTDSKKYSHEFVESAKTWIERKYTPSHVHPAIHELSIPESAADEANHGLAHEAIRPTQISLHPQQLPEALSTKEKRMYTLIWETTLASCMSDATYHSLSASIPSVKPGATFLHTSQQMDFPGWKAVKKPDKEENATFAILFSLLQNGTREKDTDVIRVVYKKILAQQQLTQTKQRYTEARLVQLLEEKGIGRPSTFSMLIDKIQEREYVKKQDVEGREIVCRDFELEEEMLTEVSMRRKVGAEKGKLVLQPLGAMVVEFLEQHFLPLFEYEYTKHMECELDLVADAAKVWHQVCRDCLNQIMDLMEPTRAMKKQEIRLDAHHVVTMGKYGPVIKCTDASGGGGTTFLSVRKDVSLDFKKTDYRLEDLVDDKTHAKKKPMGVLDGKEVTIQKGKFGLYATWGEKNVSLKSLGNRPPENIAWDDVQDLLRASLETGVVREISPHISIRSSSRGAYVFYKTPKMKKPLFYKLDGYPGDYKSDPVFAVKAWLQETHAIS